MYLSCFMLLIAFYTCCAESSVEVGMAEVVSKMQEEMMAEMKAEMAEMKARISAEMKAEMAEMKAEIAALKAKNRQADQFIGFAAYSDVDEYYTSRGEKMVFNKAPTNINADYNTETGIYTVPQKGWYFFGTTIFTDDHHVVLQIMRSGERQPGAFGDVSDHDSGSMMWLMQCDLGDQVYLEQYHNTGGSVWRGRASDDLLNAFVGFMITPIFE